MSNAQLQQRTPSGRKCLPKSLFLIFFLTCLSSGRETSADTDIQHASNKKLPTEVAGSSSEGAACPEWLTQYTKFHAANKHRPDAKYLVFLCSHTATAEIKGIDQDSETHCSYGIGDRLRGMEFVLRLAYATKRVYLIQTQYPAPMREFLVPSTIDWEMGNLSMPADFKYFVQRLSRTPETDPVANGAVAAAQEKWVAITTRQVLGTPLVDAPNVDVMGSSAQWMFHSLFKPSPAVSQSMNHQLARLDIDPGMPYVAMHMRLGGQLGEDNAVGRYEPMKVLRAALSCARQLRSAMLGGSGCGTGDPPADPSLCAAAAVSAKKQRTLLHTHRRVLLSEEGIRVSASGQTGHGSLLQTQSSRRVLSYEPRDSSSISEDEEGEELDLQQEDLSFQQRTELWSDWSEGEERPTGSHMLQEQQQSKSKSRQLLLQRSKVHLQRQEASGLDNSGGGGAAAEFGTAQQQQGAPIVVITDNLDMKSFVNDILGPHVVTTNVTPHHWGANQRRREQADLSQFVQTVGDMGVLAKSACLLISRGGFGYHAYLWGRHTCVALLDTCKRPDHPY